MNKPILLAAALVGVALSSGQIGWGQTDTKGLRGFSKAHAAEQRALEVQLLAVPRADLVREYIQVMSEEPHHTGSQASVDVANYVLAKFQEWGLDAELEEFEGLMPTPRERYLELLEPESYVPTLQEPAILEDKDSSDSGQLPSYNAYSPDGDVTGQVVYVNYGMPADYEKLAEMGVSVEGKIVLARYLGGWRGIKPKVAAEHGAIGCLIFSDPRDDGYFQNDPYPKGAMRPEFSVQRGSTMDMPVYPGDPLTPGWGSVPGGRRLEIAEAKTLKTAVKRALEHVDRADFVEWAQIFRERVPAFDRIAEAKFTARIERQLVSLG